jgi:hypothetical protein
MMTYLHCGKCLRAFSAQVRDDKGTPQDHGNELLKSDLKRVEYGRDFAGCAFDECKGLVELILHGGKMCPRRAV